ncbi:hypothetical protein D3C81_1022190 [compost metagenome]
MLDGVHLVFEGQPGFALIVIEPELVRLQPGWQHDIVGKGGEVGVPQAPLAVGHLDRFELLDERRCFHGDPFHCRCSGFDARRPQRGDQCHVLCHVQQISQGLLTVIVGPAFQAIENLEAKLGDGHPHHDLTQARYEKRSDIERLEGLLGEVGFALFSGFLIFLCGGDGMKQRIILEA